MTGQIKKRALIGDLLVRAGMISRQDLTSALTISKQLGTPIGQVLSINRFVTEAELSAALRVQALVRDRLLPERQGIEALSMVRKRHITLEQALDEKGWKSEYYEFTNNLGKLLLDANAVKTEQLDLALAACHTSGLPLARVLVLQGAMNEFVAYAALTAQMLLRDKKIARDQAVGALRLTAMHGDTLEDYLEFGGLRKLRPDHVLRLGELFVLSELVSELDLLSAVETGLIEAQPIGQVLVCQGLIKADHLDAALKLQDLIREHKLEPLETIDILREFADKGGKLEDVLVRSGKYTAEPLTKDLSASDARLLETAHGIGFIKESELALICKAIKEDGNTAEDCLLKLSRMDAKKIETALRCRELVDSGVLSIEQAIFAVHIWLWSGGDFDEVLQSVGWLPVAR